MFLNNNFYLMKTELTTIYKNLSRTMEKSNWSFLKMPLFLINFFISKIQIQNY